MYKIINEIMGWVWNIFIFGGTAYYVFERGESGWWFVLPVCLIATRSKKDREST